MIAKPDSAVLLALDPHDFPDLHGARQQLVPGVKHPENPVLGPRPGHWDGTRCKVYGTVLFDERDGLFRMWYSGSTDTPDTVRRTDGSRRHLAYAFSEDGVNWTRPSLGLVEYEGSLDNNIVLLDAQAPSVFLTDKWGDSSARFFMVTEHGLGTHRIRMLQSADGMRWTAVEDRSVDRQTDAGTHEPFSILHDPDDPDPDRRWKDYSLLHSHDGGYRGRSVGLFTTANPKNWIEYPKQPILSPFDGMESEIHIPHVSRFHQTYVMLYDAMEPNHHTQTEVAVSNDGIDFRRVQNAVKLLENGPAGHTDAGKICVSPRSMFVHRGRIWWYYTTSGDTYQTTPRSNRAVPWYRYTALAQWRQDGFARLCVAPGSESAEVTGRELEVSSHGIGRVFLNAQIPPSTGGALVDLLDSDNNVLVSSEPWHGDGLHAEVAWRKEPSCQPGDRVRLRVRFRGAESHLYAIHVDSATRTVRDEHLQSAVVGSSITDRRVKWMFSAREKISATPVVDDGSVYVTSWDQCLYAIDADTGDVRWRHRTENAMTTSPVVLGGAVYVGSRDGRVRSLDAKSGSLRWETSLHDGRKYIVGNPNGTWIDGSPAVGAWTCPRQDGDDASQRLFVGFHDRYLHALNLETGQEHWRYPTFNWILSQPAIADYQVFFASLDGSIYALDARCGALVWRYTVGRDVVFAPRFVPGSVTSHGACGSPLVANGTVYCGADDGTLYTLRASDGTELWTFQTGKWIWGRPLLTSGVLTVASADGAVYGIRADSGKVEWLRHLGNTNYAEVVAWRDLALVACTNGVLSALRPSTGEVVWTFHADGGLRAAPAVDADGTIFLPTCAGTVFALTP